MQQPTYTLADLVFSLTNNFMSLKCLLNNNGCNLRNSALRQHKLSIEMMLQPGERNRTQYYVSMIRSEYDTKSDHH